MSGKSEEIIRFEEALNADENVRNEFEAAFKKITDEDGAQSEVEAMAKAASELGFEISIDEIERVFAEMQELDEDELANVAGGKQRGVRHGCDDTIAKGLDQPDEHGHNLFCITLWHCYAITVHTQTDNKEAGCWSDYKCNYWNN